MNNTTNPLLTLGTEEIEQLLKARSTFDKLAQKFGLTASRVSNHQTASHRSPNGANGHNGHRKMSRAAKARISAGMRKFWQKRRKEKETAPA